MSPKEKKLVLLAELYKELKNYKLIMEPKFLNGENSIIVLKDDKLNEEKYVISLDNLNTVKLTALYFSVEYDKFIDSRRNAIKTAKDIFDFCHDIQVKDFSRIDKSLMNESLPRISLYYRNVAKESRVEVTATRRFSYNEFLFRGCENIHELSSDLFQLTKLIERDSNGVGKALRWEREVYIGKAWWRH